MRKLEAKQSDLKIEADFAAPAFGLLARAAEGLHVQLFSVMQRFGLTVNDISIDTPAPNLGSRGITFHLARLATIIRVQLGRVEFTCGDLSKISSSDGAALFTAIFDTLRGFSPNLQVGAYGATIGTHAVIEGQTATDFISARIREELTGLGPSTGHAVAYYFGQDGARRKLVVVIDGSALIAGAIYIRQSIEFDGSAIEYTEFPGLLLNEFHRTLRGLDLELIQ